MEASTTIQEMFSGNKFLVPTYQRAFSWDIRDEDSEVPKQIDVFLSDLEEYNNSNTKSKYYFGHFLLEEIAKNEFGVVDGQQRLTTIIIFVSALFRRLKDLRALNNSETQLFEDLIKQGGTYRFKTVDYDRLLFKDYVLDQTKKDKLNLQTQSAKRIVSAFDFFVSHLADKDESYIRKMLRAIQSSSCTNHIVRDEAEAIQMFIFQNNRGKKPSNLEIVKAQFLFNIHLYGGEEKENLIEEIKSRFENIYRYISDIECYVSEDDVLTYSLRVFFNSLWENNSLQTIAEEIKIQPCIPFIQKFSYLLERSFRYLSAFFGTEAKDNFEIHSLIALGAFSIALPFVIKAYDLNLPTSQICELCNRLESINLRHRIISTKAEIISRLKDVFQDFGTKDFDVYTIIRTIDWMKTVSPISSSWWAYWNNEQLESALQGEIRHTTAKYLLWKYENHLESQGKKGYSLTRFDEIDRPELEHIAPMVENPRNGYDDYDSEFIEQYRDCLGNYLLLSKSHNCSVGNKPFTEKLSTYLHLEQQREIQSMTTESKIWSRELINLRKEKIIKFLLKTI